MATASRWSRGVAGPCPTGPEFMDPRDKPEDDGLEKAGYGRSARPTKASSGAVKALAFAFGRSISGMPFSA